MMGRLGGSVRRASNSCCFWCCEFKLQAGYRDYLRKLKRILKETLLRHTFKLTFSNYPDVVAEKTEILTNLINKRAIQLLFLHCRPYSEISRSSPLYFQGLRCHYCNLRGTPLLFLVYSSGHCKVGVWCVKCLQTRILQPSVRKQQREEDDDECSHVTI